MFNTKFTYYGNQTNILEQYLNSENQIQVKKESFNNMALNHSLNNFFFTLKTSHTETLFTYCNPGGGGRVEALTSSTDAKGVVKGSIDYFKHQLFYVNHALSKEDFVPSFYECKIIDLTWFEKTF